MTNRTYPALAGFILALLLLPIQGCNASSPGTDCQMMTEAVQHMKERPIELVTGDRTLTVNARIADESLEMRAGFQHICPENYDRLFILFVYGQEVRGMFHMRNVKDALDIGFFDGKGRLIDVQQMQPYPGGAQSGPLTSPSGPFRFALEARSGYFAEHGLRAGETRLIWPD